ncbi:MAG: cysteine hydrolase [Oscillospiraceae bacterium]|nr:cysteine hydrolase [Oscillospiraceae bacterium]
MKKCLVIIDMQNGFINENTKHLPAKISQFIKENSFDHIVATRYCNTPRTACYKLGDWKKCMSGTFDAQIVQLIQPYVNQTFDKTTYSGFTPEFRKFAQCENFDRLYFCGVNTDCCVLATVLNCYDAVQDCVVIADLCASTLGKSEHFHALDLLRDNINADRVINACKIKTLENL